MAKIDVNPPKYSYGQDQEKSYPEEAKGQEVKVSSRKVLSDTLAPESSLK